MTASSKTLQQLSLGLRNTWQTMCKTSSHDKTMHFYTVHCNLYIFRREFFHMFGSYEFGVSLDFDTVSVETYRDNGLCIYHRKSDHDVTKVISSASGLLLVNPIEPVTQPKRLTHYLLIEVRTPILLAPGSDLAFFMTFPVEIGLFADIKKGPELGFFGEARKIAPIDSFTLTNPKYTLYGTQEKGIICKWWESSVHTRIPEVNSLQEGVLHIETRNRSNGWAELTKIVLDAYNMKIFYKDIAYMEAGVTVLSSAVAETSFREKPLTEDMEKAAELFIPGKIAAVERKPFLMEWGL